MKTALASFVLVPALAGCSLLHGSGKMGHGRTLSRDEISKAESVARRVIAQQGASVSSASVVVRFGVVKKYSNTGHPCTSGRMLQILLIGDFPDTVTTGHPVQPGDPPEDFTVRSMGVTVDARSGRECLIGVGTGQVKPPLGATMLSVD